MTLGPAPVRTREASSAKVTSQSWCSASIAPVPAQQVGEAGGAGLLELEAGDGINGHRPPAPGGVWVAGLAGDLENLGGVGEAEAVDGDGLEDAVLDAAVRLVADAVHHGTRCQGSSLQRASRVGWLP